MPAAPMQSVDWFPKPQGPKPGHELLSSALKAGVGLAVATLFYMRGYVVLAAVAAGFAIVFFAASLTPRGRALLAKVLGFVGEWAGRIVGTVLLGGIFVLVMTPVRFVRRIAGIDDLHLRGAKERSFWLVCDSEEHKRRYASAMFATEVPQASGGRRGVLVIVALVVAFAASEIGLRIQGYGHPLAYVSDPRVGYYPAPGQDTKWRGAHLETNRVGMRAPERDVAKPKGALRVLELGTDGGLRVDQPQIHARLLEKRLAERARGRVVEVWNADVEGWGLPSARGFVEAFGTFDADVAVITITPGALERTLQTVLATRFVPAEHPARLALEEKLLDYLWEYREGHTIIDAVHVETARAEGVAAAGGLARTLRDRGVEALFVIVPPRGGASPAEATAFTALRVSVEKSGARVHELSATFAGAALDPETSALTASGHAALADAIAEDLAAGSGEVRAWLGGPTP